MPNYSLAWLIEDQVATYYCGILPSEFFVALGERNVPQFHYLIIKSALLILSKAMILAISKYLASIFSLKCREVCCKTLHKHYFTNFVYYKLTSSNSQIDNPDQRMTQDVEKLTRIITVDLYTPVTTAPFITAYYTYLTYRRFAAKSAHNLARKLSRNSFKLRCERT
ncbi:unnamed protein product [Gongylonema pulchrum]|uniref:ABC transmembrane type-1 domain-containing protein n=1 Tax=Gongylonema pulchrum TaxID=637853 RepID=A0A183EMK2_9BILA|nr:unnamed protein product [Gongylonema pulchrum]